MNTNKREKSLRVHSCPSWINPSSFNFSQPFLGERCPRCCRVILDHAIEKLGRFLGLFTLKLCSRGLIPRGGTAIGIVIRQRHRQQYRRARRRDAFVPSGTRRYLAAPSRGLGGAVVGQFLIDIHRFVVAFLILQCPAHPKAGVINPRTLLKTIDQRLETPRLCSHCPAWAYA